MTEEGTDSNVGDALQEQEYSRRWAVIEKREEMCIF